MDASHRAAKTNQGQISGYTQSFSKGIMRWDEWTTKVMKEGFLQALGFELRLEAWVGIPRARGAMRRLQVGRSVARPAGA